MSRGSSPTDPVQPEAHVSGKRSRSFDALQRKRERDKRSQRNKRQREREYIASLEARIRELEAATTLVHHAQGEVNHASPLQEFSTTANSTTERIRSTPLPTPGSHHDLAIIPVSSQSPEISTSVQLGRLPLSPGRTPSSHGPFQTSMSPPGLANFCEDEVVREHIVVSPGILHNLLSTPEHLRLPMWNIERPSESYRFLTRGQAFPALVDELRSSSEMEKLCPPVPKPLDLLFGGSLNLLANFVFAELTQMPFLSPEKFAASMLIYNLLRWFVWPSPESYKRLPNSHRPTVLQLTQEHHLSFDFLIWPQVRDNLIKYGHRYELEGVMGLVCATLRLRASFGADFIVRANGEEPQVKEDFFPLIFDVEKYGLLERFWVVEYPYLVEGLDRRFLLREENLIATF